MTMIRSAGAQVRIALVVDDSAAARRRVRTVLRLGGWRVHEAIGMTDALRQAAGLDLDLVVTDMAMREGSGAELLRRLRATGCSARFLAVSSEPTPPVRAQATAAGAGACLAKPVDPWDLLDFLLGRSGRQAGPAHRYETGPGDAEPPLRVDAQRVDAAREAYMNALPHRINAVVSSIQAGNVAASGSAARLLSRASEQVGQEGVARICEAIAADAARGILSRSRLTQLVALSAGSHRGFAALTA